MTKVLPRLLLLAVVVAGVLLSPRGRGVGVDAQAAPPSGPVLSPAPAPAGADNLGASWYTVPAPDGRLILVALFDPRPDPGRPSSALVLLHGSHGFAQEYVILARQLAQASGFVTAAGCWFGGEHQDASDVTPIPCPQGPDFAGATPAAWPAVDALTRAVSAYAGGAPVVVFGHSRGAEVALQMAASGYSFQAVIASSGVYDEPSRFDEPAPYSLVGSMQTPLLLLHGTADAIVPFAEFSAYLNAVQQAGLAEPPVAHCYSGGGHDSVLHPTSAIHADAVQRISQFLLGQLPDASDCPPTGGSGTAASALALPH